MHAHDMVLNEMVNMLDEEDLKEIEEKSNFEHKENIYNEPQVVEKEVIKKLPKEVQEIFREALKHAKRAGKNIPNIHEFFD